MRQAVQSENEIKIKQGKVGKIQRQVAIFCLYLEPRMKVDDLAQLSDLIAGKILKLKSKGDPLIFVGGDMNRRSLDSALDDYADIVQINHTPTRGAACLDVLYANDSNLSPTNWPPLETSKGIRSDHLCIVFSGKVQKSRTHVWLKRTMQKHTDEAMREFGSRLRRADWNAILPEHLEPDDLVQRLQDWAATNKNELFPLRTICYRTDEPPWMTEGIRRVSKQKKRVYKREGKSRHWWQLEARMQNLLADGRSSFVDDIEKAGPNT